MQCIAIAGLPHPLPRPDQAAKPSDQPQPVQAPQSLAHGSGAATGIIGQRGVRRIKSTVFAQATEEGSADLHVKRGDGMGTAMQFQAGEPDAALVSGKGLARASGE